jgi:hypothetical protein
VLTEILAWLVPEMVGHLEVVATVPADLVQVVAVARPEADPAEVDALS